MTPSDHTAARHPGIQGKALAILYLIAAAAPLLAAWAAGIEPESRWSELGAGVAMISGAMFFLQFWSSGRSKTLSGRVGIDRTMGFHRVAAVAALLFAIVHPLLPLVPRFIEQPQGALFLLSEMLVRPRLLSGVLSLAGLVVLVGFALLRTGRGVRYEFWRTTHGPLAIVVAGLILHHALTNGDYSSAPLPEAVWLLLGGGALLTLFSAYVVRPWRMWRQEWVVESVEPTADHVWQIILRTPQRRAFRFRSGQFLWLTIAPNSPPFHDHPFSIASSPQMLPKLRLIIREAGDCTNAFGAIEPGRRVAIDGPHGGFILPSGGVHVVMIAGGVGVAPLVGMLEEAADNGDARAFRLLYAGRTPNALAGLQLIENLSQRLNLRVVKVVDASAAPPAFEQGPISRRHIEDILSGVPPKETFFLVCGPAAMMEIATDALLGVGVPAERILYERFDYGAGRGALDKRRRNQALEIIAAVLAVAVIFALR
ncbi:ferric reductase-like transmembrane domain-containing protein [Methylocystis sp. ATCC 49242]|jgi:predicted ferric reductase|uniref:ferredoxin reductase family protein n=1 Tax=Methylocystis sp. ATCC 49242 TaxID=622637 RepID=UPI0001F88911|nr:ferredoxin reductase family protein [Methylocystis sp. ATCC 49242]